MERVFTRAEVSNHTGKNEPYIIIHNKVYNVTEWLNDHPGGNAILMENAGTDATQAFEDQGHSHIARDLMNQFLIGECLPEECQLWIRIFKEVDTKRVKIFEFHYTANDHLRVPLKEKLQEIYCEHGISSKDIKGCMLTCKGTDNNNISLDDDLEDAVFPVHVKYLADGAPQAVSIVPKVCRRFVGGGICCQGEKQWAHFILDVQQRSASCSCFNGNGAGRQHSECASCNPCDRQRNKEVLD